ncbi:dihydropyrimidinase [Drepanopeziza brunnea f. sp. 'multigermtubi' MB_m1]|uniref:Dihydropyrimidinase n=1 Tax=Marssonina brunnea f. sp. multigermtubi (strain MB_m1) TaxID=1072389 RepID=K1WLX1_MARBU|nr:dihydropyrimidinase [Drepanopeziza brunnea f. sp. 'multigermtubi' MB_m1]EKD18685.1 dihydropyrimidinase [Drepanopeziza brunnea f. sp. 'multigermtubi' MB_m1]
MSSFLGEKRELYIHGTGVIVTPSGCGNSGVVFFCVTNLADLGFPIFDSRASYRGLPTDFQMLPLDPGRLLIFPGPGQAWLPAARYQSKLNLTLLQLRNSIPARGAGESTSENKATQFGAPSSDSSSPALKTKSSQIITSQQLLLGSGSSSIDPPARPKGRRSKAQFSLIPTPHFQGKSLILQDFLPPLQIYSFPIILWATFAFACTANCLLPLKLTQSQVFAAPPHLFTPAQVGFVNSAFVVAGVIGLLTAGPLSDWVSTGMRATARNNGIRETDMRLVALVPLLRFDINATGHGKQSSSSDTAIVISYALDCYKKLSGQITVSATVIKNTFGASLSFDRFGMIFFYNDWAASAGFIPPLMMSMALGVGITVIGMCIFIPYGKSFRRRTISSSLQFL